MSDYKFGDNTLLHSCGFNLASFVSIMKNGIVSSKYAKENNMSFARNFDGSNLDDYISCMRYLYVNKDVSDSAYALYAMNGLSFILEDVDYIYDKNEIIIHRSDEVLVKDYIPISKIKGIMVPSDYMDSKLSELEYIRHNATKYVNIKGNITVFKEFIKSIGGNVDSSFFDDIDRELYAINQAYAVSSDDDEKNELREDLKDVISDLNYEIGNNLEEAFIKILDKDDICLEDVVRYLNSNYLNLPIYVVSSRKNRRR